MITRKRIKICGVYRGNILLVILATSLVFIYFAHLHTTFRDVSTPSNSPKPPMWNSPFGLVVPQGPAIALPSVPASLNELAKTERKIYGGKGDKAHLGGFTSFDPMGISPTLWKHMVEYTGIKSLLDVGCGIGTSTSWFITHGLEYVQCVEGSHDAVTKSLLPELPVNAIPKGTTYDLVEHDFSRGPWWPSRTVDAVWCVEFSEHVGRNYQQNYYTAFRKAALIFVTHSNWGGWHHVEVHDDDWWRTRMEMMGFVYSEHLSKEMRNKAEQDKTRTDLVKAMQSDKSYAVGQHLRTTLQVFINPMVASLPEHAHLLAEHGCYHGKKGSECGKNEETIMSSSFKPLSLTDEMDKQWSEVIQDMELN